MICPHCGAFLPDNSPACPLCRQAVPADPHARHAAIIAAHQRGALSPQGYQAALNELVVRDAAGRLWLPAAAPSSAADALVAQLPPAPAGASAVSLALRDAAARRTFQERLADALARVAVGRNDPLYNVIRQRVLSTNDAARLAEMSDGELEGMRIVAQMEVLGERATEPPYGMAVLAGQLTPRDPPAYGFVKWNDFMR